MSELIENTVRVVDNFNQDIKSDLSSKGIDNSGEASRSIRTTVEQSGSRISIKSSGVSYLYYLDQGRGPGKFPPVDTIEKWVESKPVDAPAYLVGRKIAMEGTEIYKNKSKGIQLDEKRQKVMRELKDKAPGWAKKDILVKLRSANKF